MIREGSNVLVVTNDAHYAATIGLDQSVHVKGYVGELSLCVPLLRSGDIDTLVINMDSADESELCRLLGLIALSSPRCAVYVVGASEGLCQKANELGIDFHAIHESGLPISTLAASTARDFRGATETGDGPRHGHSDGQEKVLPQQFISVWSPKGGVGKTFIACNLATVLSQLTRSSTLLMDLDWDSADTSVHFELTEDHSVLEVLPFLGEDKHLELSAFSCRVRGCSLMVMPGPPSPELSELIRPAQVSKLLELARRQFGIVVADLPPHGYGETICQCLEESGHIVLVASQDVSALRQAASALRLLRRMGIDVDKSVRVVMNRFTKESPVSVARAEDFLGVRIALQVPECRREVEESILKGMPLVLDRPRLDASTQLRKLGTLLLGLGVSDPSARPEGFLRKWFRR